MGLGEGGAIPCPAERTGRSTTPAKSFSYAKTPIAGPQFQSALKVSCSYLQVLGSPTCPCKLLTTLVIHTLKRLASAVHLRPWPPHFNRMPASGSWPPISLRPNVVLEVKGRSVCLAAAYSLVAAEKTVARSGVAKNTLRNGQSLHAPILDATRRILTSCLTPVKNGWLESFFCSLILARKAYRR